MSNQDFIKDGRLERKDDDPYDKIGQRYDNPNILYDKDVKLIYDTNLQPFAN